MDDREAGKYAESNNITVIDIPTFLFYCKKNNILTVAEIKKIISELKNKDFYEFEKGIKEELLSKN